MLAGHQKRVINSGVSNIMRNSWHYKCKYVKVGKSTSSHEPILHEKYHTVQHISRMYTGMVEYWSVVSGFGLL